MAPIILATPAIAAPITISTTLISPHNSASALRFSILAFFSASLASWIRLARSSTIPCQVPGPKRKFISVEI